jgi:hypothetical protein
MLINVQVAVPDMEYCFDCKFRQYLFKTDSFCCLFRCLIKSNVTCEPCIKARKDKEEGK